ncbi:porin family protein [Spirosoma soli]|uniref:Porin family protein n=1 Tax=Spirosoma soli TaxID=1770529 RepID=A0ABW5M350_9BACT
MFRSISLRSTSLSVLLVLACLSTSLAQQRFSAGPRVGLNLSNYWGNSDYMHIKPGFTAGAFLMYSSLNHFGISADVLYSQLGTKYDGPIQGFNGNSTFRQRVNYLEIPVVARYFLTLSGNFRPNIFIGPSLGIKLNAKRVGGKLNGNDEPRLNGDNNNDFNDLDLGATGGFQLNWRAGNRQRFLIDARYTLGLTDVQTNLPNLWGRRNSLQNSAITLTLGYGFGVGREYPSRYKR